MGAVFAVFFDLHLRPAMSAELPFGPDLETSAWQHLEIPDYLPAVYDVTSQGDLVAVSKVATSILYQEIPDEIAGNGMLAWEWRVDTPVPITDLTKAEGDDRDLAVHVWFPPHESGGFFSALGDIAKSILGYPSLGRTLTYVWGGDQPIGTRFINPHHTADGYMIILQQGGQIADRWRHQKVNIVHDYQAVFGVMPINPPKFIAISTDSDDTGTESRGRVRRVFLTP